MHEDTMIRWGKEELIQAILEHNISYPRLAQGSKISFIKINPIPIRF
jgi:hypothetical protein